MAPQHHHTQAPCAPGCRCPGRCYSSTKPSVGGEAGVQESPDLVLFADFTTTGSVPEMPASLVPTHSARGDRPDMLDAFIIERIRRDREARERRERREQRPQLDMPRPQQRPAPFERPPPEDEPSQGPDRGVIIVDFTI